MIAIVFQFIRSVGHSTSLLCNENDTLMIPNKVDPNVQISLKIGHGRFLHLLTFGLTYFSAQFMSLTAYRDKDFRYNSQMVERAA